MTTIRNAAVQAASIYRRYPMIVIADALIAIALLYWALS